MSKEQLACQRAPQDAMSTGKSLVSGDATFIPNIAKGFLASLTEITPSIVRSKIEKNKLLDIGCYFYRASSAIMKLAENCPDNAIEILQSLTEYGNLAEGILGKLRQSEPNILDHEVKNTIKQLEGIINHMGEDLSSVPISAFRGKKYLETATRSLSEEMKRVRFQETEPNNQQIKLSHQEDNTELEYTPTEEDLYSVSIKVCTENSHISDFPQLLEALAGSRQSSHRRPSNMRKRPTGSITEAAQYVEPIYKSFICPLTFQIMDDPVTIQGGVTYERRAITEYFERYGNSEDITCPATRVKLQSIAMSPNIALRNIINEWKDRNETARLKVIRESLSTGSTDGTKLEALEYLQTICQTSAKKMMEVRNMEIIPVVVQLLQLRDRNVRCAALKMIQLLAQEDEGKELVGKTSAISETIRMLSSSHQPIRHAALLLLIELSKSKPLSEKIGHVTGGILILIQTKYNRSIDTFASEAADQILRNAEQCPSNIKLMAESGYLEPLINNLVEGSEERKLEMVTYLGDIILEDDSKTYVAKRASHILAQMLQNGDPSTRKTVCKALAQISSDLTSGRTLVEAGIVGTIIQEIFSKEIFSEPLDYLKEALAILVNIFESGLGLENLMVTSQGNTMVSGYILFNIIYMIENSTSDDLNISLIRILYHLTKSSKSVAPIISAVKESEASYTLVELLNNPSDEIAIAVIKLLTLLSADIGHLIIDRLCKTKGQPEALVQISSNPSQITERQALSSSFLAKLPHQNLTLNLALLSKNTIPGILQSISQYQLSAARPNRFASMYLEGLVGILVRITATLYDPQVFSMAVNYNFASVLTELLIETSSDEVQRLAATALEKLSAQSIHLSKPPQRKKKKFLNLFYLPQFLVIVSSRKTKAKVCVVHKGFCSKQNTFCLIEARAVERLLSCLESRNVDVAEAALSALSTLVDDKVDIARSVNMLSEMKATEQLLKAVRYHKNDSLWQKAFWMLERFLMIGGKSSLSLVSQDRLFSVSVVTAFHHGDAYTRQMAEKILRYLDKMPSLTGTFTM